MSLVGSLEDLGLTDILQIVSLARKSGRLLLRSGNCEGRIVLCDGAVRAALIKGEGEDLRSLLVARGVVSADDFERASEHAGQTGRSLREAVVEVTGLASERLDALRREQVEQAIMRMFSWRNGEFSFEVRDDVDPEDAEQLLPNGINTQYLAMEATRLRDEGAAKDAGAGVVLDLDEGPLFSGESAADEEPAAARESPAPSMVDTVALAAAQAVDGTPEQASAPAGPLASGARAPAARPAAGGARPVVALDADLNGLEWLKACVAPQGLRVHIFQRVDLAVERIRQYLVRGVAPVVVAGPGLIEAAGEPSLLARLRALSPRLRVLAWVEAGAPATAPDYDGVLERPASLPAGPEGGSDHEALADDLRRALAELAGDVTPEPAPPGASSRAALDRLREVSDRLRDPSGSHDVLSVVLDYAAAEFARVAIFMIREDAAVGMARRGFDPVGAPPGLEEVELATGELPEPFAAALAARRGVCAPLGPRSGAVAGWLGGDSPREAYVGPIESGGVVAALLYADRGPERRPIGDTTALEVVLHEAGLALDRSALERALADAERG